MDVDIETSLDAQKVADFTGVPSIQIHNGDYVILMQNDNTSS
ncbi:MAG: hypothetical protein ACLR43_10850 [Faecalibacillus faecis]